ncbi:lipopolysaccharide assembly protein LapA domain-containing protein [Umezawaea sp. Da 62-37]|uniref:LapA family protein n=1 Tax=Umezawaea sp. Da 62-37 TaxID=3075927 RepID=UPI0028F74CC2|nr:lipopolysaccharide assembly protein LapA domain-containing protein [Umezawaea sp. Da 62-37]WNV89134.1 lipopolysaccharide assembly protein LapA domain-containing protein [Umezawaea sp. Da 62-37]
MSTPRDDRATDLHPAELGVPVDPSTPSDEPTTHQPPALPDLTDPTPDFDPTPAPTPAPHVKLKPTRISGTWVAVIIAIFVLIFLLVFILQNLAGITIHFLGGAFTLPLGVALLFAAIGGALLIALIGAARIMQLRRQTKRALR